MLFGLEGKNVSNNSTKQKVVDAASLLFYQKGFDGTSVRDIAMKASVNVSLISYYFKGKQGLLEYAVTNYYETYLSLIEETLENHQELTNMEKLKKVIYSVVKYKVENYQLTSFIQRELTLDSTFVREMSVTYLAKEDYYLKQLFYSVLHPYFKQKRTYLYMQLKGIFMSPFLIQEDWNYRLLDQASYQQFIHHFTETIYEWLETLTSEKRRNEEQLPLQ